MPSTLEANQKIFKQIIEQGTDKDRHAPAASDSLGLSPDAEVKPDDSGFSGGRSRSPGAFEVRNGRPIGQTPRSVLSFPFLLGRSADRTLRSQEASHDQAPLRFSPGVIKTGENWWIKI
jgi:hypothetical protein